MNLICSFIAGVLASLIATYISPPFRRLIDCCFSRIFHLLDPNRYDLTGKWKHVYKEPSPEVPSLWIETEETVQLKHIGSVVTGKGKTTSIPRDFVYDCRTQHNLVFGSYTKQGERGNITGRGLVQVIVSPDRLKMEGQATWFDHDTEKIESSYSRWTKIA